jgi:HSP20 family protein
MLMSNLVPSIWRRGLSPARSEGERSFYSLQRDMNRLFDEIFCEPTTFGRLESRWDGFSPSIDARETDKEVIVKAELPGIDEKDIDVSVAEDCLTIRGEKKEEKERKDDGYYHVERSYGAFHREIPLPAGVDTKDVYAGFKNGVLTVKMKKTESAEDKRKKVTIKAE